MSMGKLTLTKEQAMAKMKYMGVDMIYGADHTKPISMTIDTKRELDVMNTEEVQLYPLDYLLVSLASPTKEEWDSIVPSWES